MKNYALFLVLTCCFGVLGSPVFGDLAPSTVKKMKEKASDVVEVKITSVKVVKTEKDVFHRREVIELKGKVQQVQRSDSKLAKDDEITISSYRLSGAIPPGPLSPPEISVGWTGKIYLKKLSGDKQFDIAVYGHSFEESKKSPK